MNASFILKGQICHTPTAGRLEIHENAYAVCGEGVCRGVFAEIPDCFRGLRVIDCGDRLILPGMTDLHIHAPQFAYRGTGMDYELMDWLRKVAFPEEIRYADAAYAAAAYEIFASRLRLSATTRAVIFATVHTEATLLLMDQMERSGIVSLVGRVSMDRNAPTELAEPGAAEAALAEERFITEAARRGYRRTGPIITPRFVPSCTRELMAALGDLRRKFALPVQSHLSENPGEVSWVAELEPEAAFYGDAYDRSGLFGREGNTVMAHCVYSAPEEVRRMLDNGVWVAHCPSSNMNIASGIAPVRRYLEKGLRVGLGTDVAGGTCESMFRAVTDAIQVSKLYWRYVDQSAKPIAFPEAFWMATKGGGSFFGRVGAFEEGYAFDALVLDDASEKDVLPQSVRNRLERAFYLGLDRTGIVHKFVSGEQVF